MLSLQFIITGWPSALVCICNWNAAHLDTAVHFKVEVLPLLHWDIPMHFNYHEVFLAAAPQTLNNELVHHWPKEWEEEKEGKEDELRGRNRKGRVNKVSPLSFPVLSFQPPIPYRRKIAASFPAAVRKQCILVNFTHLHNSAQSHSSCHASSLRLFS